MGTDEMMGELAEAANDMGYIARRAQIAAGNLRAVADWAKRKREAEQ